MQTLSPPSLAPPFGAYSHGVVFPAAGRVLRTSGQLALAADGTIPADAGAQADLCFAAIAAILAEAGMSPAHVVHLSAFVTDRAHMPAYMAARDRFLAGITQRPASTLLIVSGFTRPEFLVEVEAMAVDPRG
jgi:enamine deaminase RidA (YjgF/YER057c/UK114 family)